jgi:SAM-dependent methyltransferase
MSKFFGFNILTNLGVTSMEHITPGISLFGNRFRWNKQKPIKRNSYYAAAQVIKMRPRNLLDIGAGKGAHSDYFSKNGIDVTWLDLGTSIYAQDMETRNSSVKYIFGNFLDIVFTEKFEFVWAAHVLEHQSNVGQFLNKILQVTADNGYICITVPNPHRNLWGGHLSLWTPGLLAYNIVLSGVDLKNATWINGVNEFSVVYKKQTIILPKDLTYDSGDLKKLSHLLPDGLGENTDPWNVKFDF